MAARLIDTTPLRYTVPGQPPIGRHCRTWALDGGNTLTLVTELPADEGMSVTNAAEEVRSALEARFGEGCRIAEHYPWPDDEHYDEQVRSATGGIRWQRLVTEELRAELGPQLEETRPSTPLPSAAVPMPAEEYAELFQFGAFGWDVTAALQLAEGLPVRQLHAEPLFQWLPLIAVDTAHAAEVDLDRPVLVATVADMDGLRMVIDGWHRLYRAHSEGRTHLPCRVLDEQQEFRVRAFGGRKGSPRSARQRARGCRP